MEIETLAVGPGQANCYLVWNDGREALVIDPGSDAPEILLAIRSLRLTVIAYPLTHGHIDHVGALSEVHAKHPAEVGMHPADSAWAFTSVNQLPPWYEPVASPTTIARAYQDAQVWNDSGMSYRIIFTPGHTPGGVCFYFEQDGILISGDSLFAGSIGRTDLPGGDMDVLMKTLIRLMTLPDETRVLPGHGPETTIGREKQSNPFLQSPNRFSP